MPHWYLECGFFSFELKDRDKKPPRERGVEGFVFFFWFGILVVKKEKEKDFFSILF